MRDYTVMPPAGRNGVQGVRVLNSMSLTGWRKINPNATFQMGQLATLATLNGEVVVETVDNVSDKVVGIFYCNNTTLFYRPSFREVHTFGENEDAPNDIYLKPYVRDGYYVIEAANGTDYTKDTDYSINIVNGVVTRLSGSIGATTTVYANYQYKDILLSGINQVLGSGCVALLEEVGEIATLVYDTTCAWTLGATVYYTASGYLTTTSSGSSAVGSVTKAPSASDPELYVKLNLA